MKVNLFASWSGWSRTEALLQQLTPECYTIAARQAGMHQRITDERIQEILKLVTRVGWTSPGSDEKKSYLLAELKSSMVYYGCPLIFLTLNPADRHSPVALRFAGESIDVMDFAPELWSSTKRLQLMMHNPAAVVEYFHTTVSAIIKTMLKGGLFGELVHYYGPIEYQGRGTPHIHLAVLSHIPFSIFADSSLQLWIKGVTSPDQIRDRSKVDEAFRDRLLRYIGQVSSECMPEPVLEGPQPRLGHYVFQPFLHPLHPSFLDDIKVHVDDLVRSRQMHGENHNPTCFKSKDKTKCRARFPRQIAENTWIDLETGVVIQKRDHPWLNGYNIWIILCLRGNHDCKILLTKTHALAVVYYVLKYISKPEASLYSKIMIAAAAREAFIAPSNMSTTAKSLLLKTYNKLESHREVGLPEAISNLLHYPDHYTEGVFETLNTSRLLRYMHQPLQSPSPPFDSCPNSSPPAIEPPGEDDDWVMVDQTDFANASTDESSSSPPSNSQSDDDVPDDLPDLINDSQYNSEDDNSESESDSDSDSGSGPETTCDCCYDCHCSCKSGCDCDCDCDCDCEGCGCSPDPQRNNRDTMQPPDAQLVVINNRFSIFSPFNDYAFRGPLLSEYTLYDYCSLVRKAKRVTGVPFLPDHPQSKSHRQVVRDVACIPSLLGRLLFVHGDAAEKEKREDYYCILTALFVPWAGMASGRFHFGPRPIPTRRTSVPGTN
jgi:Helitron helicase-like domain at N-terminus